MVVILYKNKGETPLESLKRVPNPDNLPLTYAGRLDPLAEGVLVVLSGDECKKKEKYLDLSKEYEFKILFGFKTDSYDLLGLGQEVYYSDDSFKKEIENKINDLKGEILQSYPPFSSKPVLGKPLYLWAKLGQLFQIKIPKHTINIFKTEILNWGRISKNDLWRKIKEDVSLVRGDFRQSEVLAQWETLLKRTAKDDFAVLSLRVSCSSGTYIRSIANDLGGVAVDIVRTRVGEYTTLL